MISEHDRVVLATDLPKEGLKAGDIGTVVHIHGMGEGYIVEFFTVTGETIAVVPVEASQVREITDNDVSHARPMEAAA